MCVCVRTGGIILDNAVLFSLSVHALREVINPFLPSLAISRADWALFVFT